MRIAALQYTFQPSSLYHPPPQPSLYKTAVCRVETELPTITQTPTFSSSRPLPFVRLNKPHPILFSLFSQKLQVSKTGRGAEGKDRISGRILFIILSEQIPGSVSIAELGV